MDLDDYDFDQQPSAWRRRWLRIGAAVSLSLMVGLALWPRQAVGDRGDADEAAACGAKLGTLAMAIATNHAIERTLSEREINARLGRLLDQNQDQQQARGLTLGLTGLSIDLGKDTSALYVSGRLLVVPVVFEARFGVDERPTDRGDRDASLRLQSLRLGRLPLIGPFKALIASQMQALLAQLPTESTVLERFDALEMDDDQVTIFIDGNAAGEMVLPAD